jgi:hypothetical protein
MRNTIILIGLLVITYSTICAQTNWQSATLTTVDGKVMHGEVNDRQWSDMIEEIDFRKNKKSSTLSFNREDIDTLLVGGQIYVGRAIEFIGSSREKSKQVTMDKKSSRSEFGILKVLIEGSINLLQYYDDKGEDHYFIEDANGTTEYLEYGLFRKDNENRNIELNSFRSFLLKRLEDCNSLSAKIVSTTYDEKSLIKLFEDYHACIGEVINKPTTKTSKWILGVAVGFSKISPEFRNSIVSAAFSEVSPTVVTLGGRLLYYPYGLDGGSAFHFGIEHFGYEYEGSINRSHLYKREQTIRLSIGPRFEFAKKPYPIYGEFLVGYDFLIKYAQTWPRSVNPDDIEDPLSPEMFHERNGSGKISMGLNMGINFGKLDFSIRTFIANRNLSMLPKESLYGIGGNLSYNF